MYYVFVWLQLRFCPYHLFSGILFWSIFVYFSLFILLGPCAFLCIVFIKFGKVLVIIRIFSLFPIFTLLQIIRILDPFMLLCWSPRVFIFTLLFSVCFILDAQCIVIASGYFFFLQCVTFCFRFFSFLEISINSFFYVFNLSLHVFVFPQVFE